MYRNPPGISPAEIVITESCLVARRDTGQTRIVYDEIADIRVPGKGTGGRIRLELKGGEHTELVIGGRHGTFEDVYEFVRFLLRVTEDARETTST